MQRPKEAKGREGGGWGWVWSRRCMNLHLGSFIALHSCKDTAGQVSPRPIAQMRKLRPHQAHTVIHLHDSGMGRGIRGGFKSHILVTKSQERR